MTMEKARHSWKIRFRVNIWHRKIRPVIFHCKNDWAGLEITAVNDNTHYHKLHKLLQVIPAACKGMGLYLGYHVIRPVPVCLVAPDWTHGR
jgi:hypothetical protein